MAGLVDSSGHYIRGSGLVDTRITQFWILLAWAPAGLFPGRAMVCRGPKDR